MECLCGLIEGRAARLLGELGSVGVFLEVKVFEKKNFAVQMNANQRELP